ncbi:MAG: DNA repair protein RadC [Lachnospiraceae bacterium]|nr:DNA repair protein RadC [Lachnospiraceae bacterium]
MAFYEKRESKALLPYEKFLKMGPESLTEEELLAIILRTGTKRLSALDLAGRILELPATGVGGLNALHHLSVKELMEIPGIGEVKAVKLKCISELAVRMASQKAKQSLRFENPGTVAAYFMEEMRHKEKEEIFLLSLDNRLQLIEKYVLSVGTVNAALLSPREVFVHACQRKATFIMLLHNHPGGDSHASAADIQITRQIKEAGEILGINLMDHIIIGNGNYYSMKENGLL